jgi:hypothetical protein
MVNLHCHVTMAALTRQDSHTSRSKTTAEAIRRVFLACDESYAPAEAAELLGWTPSEMERAIEEGAVEITRGRSGDQIAWQEVVTLLTARCPQAAIEEALGPAMASVMPEPVRLAELRIRLPRYQVTMLAKLAERERISVDELMARHLLDLASSEAAWLGRRIAGFEGAMRWPGE